MKAYKRQLIPYREAPAAKFSQASIDAFAEIFGLVTSDWGAESRKEWDRITAGIRSARKDRELKDKQAREEEERREKDLQRLHAEKKDLNRSLESTKRDFDRLQHSYDSEVRRLRESYESELRRADEYRRSVEKLQQSAVEKLPQKSVEKSEQTSDTLSLLVLLMKRFSDRQVFLMSACLVGAISLIFFFVVESQEEKLSRLYAASTPPAVKVRLLHQLYDDEVLSFRQLLLPRVDLSGSVLSLSDLSGADLSGARLTGGDLRGALLQDANLTRADLSEVDLTRANLRGAVLSGARWDGANLTGADLEGSRADSRLASAATDESTTLPDGARGPALEALGDACTAASDEFLQLGRLREEDRQSAMRRLVKLPFRYMDDSLTNSRDILQLVENTKLEDDPLHFVRFAEAMRSFPHLRYLDSRNRVPIVVVAGSKGGDVLLMCDGEWKPEMVVHLRGIQAGSPGRPE